MKIIDCGTSGQVPTDEAPTWDSLELDAPWRATVEILNPASLPRPAQIQAIRDMDLLRSRRNLIVSAPTNAGKSLIGTLALLEAVGRKRRALLLEPLRAIAREKTDEFEAKAKKLGEALGGKFSVKISTGDYRLEDEEFSDPPPEKGELIIATPERFDAIMRNPENEAWLNSIGAMCVDEAHMVSDGRRGATLENVITTTLCFKVPPRLILLSATLGNVDRAVQWLDPCDVVLITERCPPLSKQILELAEGESADSGICTLLGDVLDKPGNAALVFVNSTAGADNLAEALSLHLGAKAGPSGALPYHSKMPLDRKFAHSRQYLSGDSRCIVSTTALSMGVNLPATHVIVRDLFHFGTGDHSTSDLIQMMGRAGRGNTPGHAYAIIDPTRRCVAELKTQLQDEGLPDFSSNYDRQMDLEDWREGRQEVDATIVANSIVAQLARHPTEGQSEDDLRNFFARSLGGQALAGYLAQGLQWLCDRRRVLAHRHEDDHYRLTRLGRETSRGALPLPLATGYAQLLRDLMLVDADDSVLEQWCMLDHLIVIDLLLDSPRPPDLKRFSMKLADQVDGYMEASDEKSLLYRDWIAPVECACKATEIIQALGVDIGKRTSKYAEQCRKRAYIAVFRSILLVEMGCGRRKDDLTRRWQVKNLEGVEEKWRDSLLWVLTGLARILDAPCFLFHLLKVCHADEDRIKRIVTVLHEMRNQTYDLQERIKYCSPLGPVLRGVRSLLKGGKGHTVGVQTIRRLENAGITSISALVELSAEDFKKIGIRDDFAKQIMEYIRRWRL